MNLARSVVVNGPHCLQPSKMCVTKHYQSVCRFAGSAEASTQSASPCYSALSVCGRRTHTHFQRAWACLTLNIDLFISPVLNSLIGFGVVFD